MQLKFFTIPLHGGAELADELNAFLRSERVLAVERQLIQAGAASAWAICVCYLPAAGRPQPGKKGKIDYREVLSEADFALFARLRELRKRLAEEEGVPAYALFTNEQLAAMVQQRVRSAAAMQAIEGVGAARIERHGAAFLRLLQAAPPALPNGEGSDAGAA